MKLIALTSPVANPIRNWPLPRWRARSAVKCCAFLALGFLLWKAFQILIWTNIHTVVDGRLYRSAQLSESQLTNLIREKGIGTVVNLRGYNGWEAWYQAEARATSAAGISQEDVTTSANVYPNPVELRKLVEIFDRSEPPLLVHCRRGADRTGLASGIYLLLYTDAKMADARWVCSPRYGHFRLLTTARMDEFFDFYEEYLRSIGSEHSPAVFRDWILNRYQSGQFVARLTLLEHVVWKRNQSLTMRVRAENLSSTPWRMSAGNFAGVHLRYQLVDAGGNVLATERAGLFDHEVPPAGFVDLDVCLSPMTVPGTYYLTLDMTGEKHIAFSKIGVPITVLKFEIR